MNDGMRNSWIVAIRLMLTVVALVAFLFAASMFIRFMQVYIVLKDMGYSNQEFLPGHHDALLLDAVLALLGLGVIIVCAVLGFAIGRLKN